MILISITQSLNTIIQQTQANLPILVYVIAIPWIMYLLILISNKRLLLLGIIPRHFLGLLGIFFAPILHADFNHLFFNTIPLLVLSNFLLIQGLSYFLLVTASITLLSGLAIWCFAKPGIHVGASALITGYWGLLVSNIYQQGGVTNLILGLLSLYYFAGIFLGIFPRKKGVSWEGHLFGLMAGLATGYYLS
jgi:membrane associated rhomboid family serine protease